MLSKEWSPSGNLHWIDVMSRLRLFNNDILVSMWVGPDGKNSESHIVQVNFFFKFYFENKIEIN